MANQTGYCGVFKFETIYGQIENSPESLSVTNTVFCVISCIAMTATLSLNGIFLAAMTAHRRLQTTGIKLFMMLSVLDLLQGITLWPGGVAHTYLLSQLKFNCLLIDLLTVFGYSLGFMVISALFMIALDQYIAIQNPYFYQHSVTISRLLVPLMIGWLPILVPIFTIKFAFPRAWNPFKTVFAILIFSLLFAMFYFYIRIWRTVKRVNKAINAMSITEGTRIKKRAKAAKTAWIVLLTCLFCYTPLLISNFYEIIQVMPPFVQMHIEPLAELLAVSNSIWDPLVYYLRMKKIRQITKVTFLSSSRVQEKTQSQNLKMTDVSL